MTPAHPSDTPAFSHYGGRPATPAGLTRAPAPRGGRGGSGGDMLDSLMGDLTDSHSTASIYAELQPPSPQGTSSLALARKGEPAAKKMWAGLDRGLRLLQARLHPRSNFFPVSSTCGCLERHAFCVHKIRCTCETALCMRSPCCSWTRWCSARMSCCALWPGSV